MNTHTAAPADTITAVAELDPRLLDDPATRVLVDIGAQHITEVTDRYGSPSDLRWASGTVEKDVPMAYHNAGSDGHSSVGALGAGVPRSVLQIAAAVNAAAGRELVTPRVRAATFAAAAAHDHTQLCGRSLMPEGQRDGCGDERLSADTAHARCLAAGVPADTAHMVRQAIAATAFNPETRAQSVDYDQDPELVLAQELTANADLLSLAVRRGPLSSLEHVAEALALRQHGRIIQRRLPAATSINNLLWLLDCIGGDTELRAAFVTSVEGQARFYEGHRYSDRHIRELCGGAGIDDLFPGRAENAETLRIFVGLLGEGHTPGELWHQARVIAGYTQR